MSDACSRPRTWAAGRFSVTNHLAILTPRGRGAIATIGVRGPAAREIVGRCFKPASGKPLTHFGPGRVVFGTFDSDADASSALAEELVVGVLAEDEVEVHCHGGVAAVAATCQALAAAGAEFVSPENWARDTSPDPLAAEALLALSLATTSRTAQILLDQYRGALRGALEHSRQLFRAGRTTDALARLEELIARSDVGSHLTSPWRVVLAGRPNVGKSSLINRLVGYERAIVYDQPGTTRDVLSAATALAGWPIELSDTAGLRTADDDLEAVGISRAHEQLVAADLVLVVGDAAGPWTAADDDVWTAASVATRRAPLALHNKCDLQLPPDDNRPAGLPVSAVSGAGVETLLAAIVARLVPRPPEPGVAVPFTARQVHGIESALARPEEAERYLNDLIGGLDPASPAEE
jgi:tRNA modification GTPase